MFIPITDSASPTSLPARAGKVGAGLAALQVDLCVTFSAAFAGLPKADLLAKGRGKRRISQARHLAIYLAHTSFGLGFSQLAPLFGRDRASLRHACRQIEDLRDDASFDAALARIEQSLETCRTADEANFVHVKSWKMPEPFHFTASGRI